MNMDVWVSRYITSCVPAKEIHVTKHLLNCKSREQFNTYCYNCINMNTPIKT